MATLLTLFIFPGEGQSHQAHGSESNTADLWSTKTYLTYAMWRQESPSPVPAARLPGCCVATLSRRRLHTQRLGMTQLRIFQSPS